MKELKKILNKSSNYIYKILNKLSDFIKNDEYTTFIKTILKVIVLILIYSICGLIADGLNKIGHYIIYQVADTGRSLLSGIWTITVNLTFFIFITSSLYQLITMAVKDNNFIVLYQNKKKNKDVKRKLFLAMETVVKILGTISLIPLFIGDIGALFLLGILIGYLRKGIYLISLFFFVIGIILFFTSIILLIKKLISITDMNFKKHVITIIVAGTLIAGSSLGVLLETSSYSIDQNLTTDFHISTIKQEYKMDPTKEYIIYNNNNNKNLNLVIDDDLGSYIEIIIKHSTTSEVKSSIKNDKDKVKIFYNQDLNIQTEDLKNIINLGVSCIKDKTIYNYTLLKYAEIEVRVSSKYAENIKFIDAKGKEYTPYERSN